MNSKQLAGGVFVGVFAVHGLTWLMMPSVPFLHDADRAVEQDASEGLERARRLLQRYSFSLARASSQSLRLEAVGVEASNPDALSEKEYRDIHQKLWADFPPANWGDRPGLAKASYGNIPAQIRDGVSSAENMLTHNQQWLDDALAEVDAALRGSRSGASSSEHSEAMRLKGAILYQQGVAAWLEAKEIRRLSMPYRNRLAELASEASEHRAALGSVSSSGIDAQIELLKNARTADQASLKATSSRLADIDGEIARIEALIAAAQERGDRAELEMGRLQDDGADLTRADGAEAFTSAFLKQDADYRSAQREIQSWQMGSLPHAQIDQTEDYLRGQYIENGSSKDLTVRPGLRYFNNERSIVSRTQSLEQRSFGELEQDIARLDEMKITLQESQNLAQVALQELKPLSDEAFAGLEQVEADAAELEDLALSLFSEAERVSQQAARFAKNRIRQSSRQAQLASIDARSRSAFDAPSKAGGIAGHITAQVADARAARAWVLYDRFGAHQQNAHLFGTLVGILELSEEDVEAEKEASEEAREGAIEAVEAAMETLEDAHNDTARHWTLVAQAGGTVYLLALLGDESYVADTLESYRLAIQGRENDRAAGIYVQRIAQLESK